MVKVISLSGKQFSMTLPVFMVLILFGHMHLKDMLLSTQKMVITTKLLSIGEILLVVKLDLGGLISSLHYDVPLALFLIELLSINQFLQER